MREINRSNHQKGFITVATGDERYYQLAANLCLSYKKWGGGKYPFALICDRENEYTALFDDVVITGDIRRSTVDKLLLRLSPYQESVFLDADTLVLKSIDDLWDIFEDQDDVSAFGCTLPLDSQKGWFTLAGSGPYRDRIRCLISMNGGIYYFRNTPRGQQILQDALDVIPHYSAIDFKYFDTPQDEPLMAMAMVINGCHPCDIAYHMIVNPSRHVTVTTSGQVLDKGRPCPAKLIHFATAKTRLFLYNYLAYLLHHQETGRTGLMNYCIMRLRYAPTGLKALLFHQCGAVMRALGLSRLVDRLKKALR